MWAMLCTLVAICLSVWLLMNLHLNNTAWFRPSLRVQEITVHVNAPQSSLRSWPQHMKGTSYAVMTDLHYDGDGGRTLDTRLLEEAIERVNQASVDAVFLLGDFVQKGNLHVPRLVSHYLSRLTTKRGQVYAVLGNHDDPLPVRSLLERHGVRVLENETTALAPGVLLSGFGDLGRRRFHPELCQLELRPSSSRVIALSHNPDTAVELSRLGVDIQLSGHTHGSQVRLPFWGSPLPLISAAVNSLPALLRRTVLSKFGFINVLHHNWSWLAGSHLVHAPPGAPHSHASFLHVSCGIGSHYGLRLGVPPEITILRFE